MTHVKAAERRGPSPRYRRWVERMGDPWYFWGTIVVGPTVSTLLWRVLT
jgi:hypothetical protein